jgi:hypothetical protein
MTFNRIDHSLWLTRLLIAIVTAWNLQAALVFILQPEGFMHNFELNGVPGAAAVRGTGILFVMWNVPYLVALWNPRKYFLALRISIVMQSVGLVGESFILLTLPDGHATLSESILRFIIFDGSGLILLVVAFWILNRRNTRAFFRKKS